MTHSWWIRKTSVTPKRGFRTKLYSQGQSQAGCRGRSSILKSILLVCRTEAQCSVQTATTGKKKALSSTNLFTDIKHDVNDLVETGSDRRIKFPHIFHGKISKCSKFTPKIIKQKKLEFRADISTLSFQHGTCKNQRQTWEKDTKRKYETVERQRQGRNEGEDKRWDARKDKKDCLEGRSRDLGALTNLSLQEKSFFFLPGAQFSGLPAASRYKETIRMPCRFVNLRVMDRYRFNWHMIWLSNGVFHFDIKHKHKKENIYYIDIKATHLSFDLPPT